jgi:UDP-2-acetamido-3-amino-2,3-dideoxy-glucuronate N-acetyltransferase
MRLHQRATVEDARRIGAGTSVWQFASVIRGAVVGKNCTVGSCSVLDGCKVGDRCSIGHGAQIHPGVHIGDDVFIGPGAIFCNDMWPSTSKDGFDYSELLKRPTTIVADHASIGAGAIILPGVTIGSHSLVAAGATCDQDVPDGQVFHRYGHVEPMPPEHFRERMKWPSA